MRKRMILWAVLLAPAVMPGVFDRPVSPAAGRTFHVNEASGNDANDANWHALCCRSISIDYLFRRGISQGRRGR